MVVLSRVQEETVLSPSLTVAPGSKSAPVMVAHAPPRVEPTCGAMAFLRG
jgi:hypothetical protein